MTFQSDWIILDAFLIFIEFSLGDGQVQKDNWCCINLFSSHVPRAGAIVILVGQRRDLRPGEVSSRAQMQSVTISLQSL